MSGSRTLDLLTSEQVCDLLQISRRTLCRMTTRGPDEHASIPHARVGPRALRFDRPEVEAWVLMGCPPAADFRRLYRRGTRHATPKRASAKRASAKRTRKAKGSAR